MQTHNSNIIDPTFEYENSDHKSPQKGSISDTIIRNFNINSNNEATKFDAHRREVS